MVQIGLPYLSKQSNVPLKFGLENEYSIMISGIFDGKLRYFEEDHDAISNNNTASIRPFAQDDVMMTMMKGVSPDLYKTVLAESRSNLESYKEMVLNAITECGVSDNVLAKVKELDIDELQKKYEQSLSDFIDENYVDGLVDAVNSFNIEDMITTYPKLRMIILIVIMIMLVGQLFLNK